MNLHTKEEDLVPIPPEVFSFIDKQLQRYFDLLKTKPNSAVQDWCFDKIAHIEETLLGGPIYLKENKTVE